jgi:YbbR domain-containing protein
VDRLLRNELFVRLFALALAILVYLQARGAGGGMVQRTIPGVPVQVLGVPDDLVVVGVQPETVTVTVSGIASLINRLDTSKLGASVNLTGASPGTHAYFAQVTVPPGVQLVTYNPVDVTVRTERLVTQETAVVAQTRGTPAQGFGVVGTIDVQPKVVVLQGPASAVDSVVRTVVSVPVDHRRTSVTVQAEPQPQDLQGRVVPGVTVLPRTVQVTVPIGPAMPGRAVPVRPAVTGQPAAGYAVTGSAASPEAVLVIGPADAVGSLQAVTTEPVSVAGATGTVRATVPVLVPPGAVTVDPTTVTVTVTVGRGQGG